ncbi:alpha/beta hydrolase family protein [Robertkochia aurantiaca]|uniref:alpha/beta hydrolase family protein n=1 Tax=Robertkochia aurantiaca TaxID=2873700 RepID=UPI001CD0293A|nr:prolyl oligopeptidase family serine peptidase [Robertkochia sp. 3YJGBD-33]
MIIKKAVLAGLACFPLLTWAQKKPLTPKDFDNWRRIENRTISSDGNYLMYEYSPGMGDGDLIISDLSTMRTDTVRRGQKAGFSGTNRFAVFSIGVPLQTRRIEETSGVSAKKRQMDSLGIYLFSSREIRKIPDVTSFKMPEKGTDWLAYKTVVDAKEGDKGKEQTPEDEKAVDSASSAQSADTLLVAYNPVTLDSVAFENIEDYKWAGAADVLLMSSKEKDSAYEGALLIRFDATENKIDTLYRSEGQMKHPVITEDGEKVAFMFSKDTTKIKTYHLYSVIDDQVREIPVEKTERKPGLWTLSEHRSPFFSENGKRLFFGTAYPQQEPEKDTLLNVEREKLDIWSWTDKRLQPQQKLSVKQDQNRSFLAVYHLDQGRSVQLSDSILPEVRILDKGDGSFIIGTSSEAYEKAQSWSGLWIHDFYLIDLLSGERRLLMEGQGDISVGPAQRYGVYYDRNDSIYYSISLKNLKRTALTETIETPFYDELNDRPMEPRPYGVMGWAQDDDYIFVYDRYDIWRLDPEGKRAPRRVTTDGRETKTEYRYIKLDDEQRFINTREEVLLRVFEEKSKRSGLAWADLRRSGDLTRHLTDDHGIYSVSKASDADVLVYQKQSFADFPDIFISDMDFEKRMQVSNGGSQLGEFKWGDVQLVQWQSYDGDSLQGLLYTPEKMVPGKKYPMVTYFYERSSDGLHRFVHPSPSRSTVNRSFYVSNDYILFVPDIVYREGKPGQSAYDCIVSGVEEMVAAHDFIDGSKVALQGQSWGGYQTAYLITRTDRFAAAMAGAPVSNMTSAYGGIRWGSGLSRMFQYEKTQSRLGATLWEDPDVYLENSPLFYADKIETPLLMMHNDNDGAVPWYQGIEFFVALRRLDKPVWMLTYNDEPHNLKGSSWGNRKDLSIRMKQFFDHFLKDEAAAEWIEKGRPAVEKGVNRAY